LYMQHAQSEMIGRYDPYLELCACSLLESSWSNKCAQLDFFPFFKKKKAKKDMLFAFLTSIKRNDELDIVFEHEQVLHSLPSEFHVSILYFG